MTPSSVLSKRDFVCRYVAGEFGNRPLTWATYEELIASGYRGLVHVRNSVRGGLTYYNVPFERVALLASSTMYYTAMNTPDHLKTLQGEVCDWPGGPYLLCSRQAGPMRAALVERPMILIGLSARLLLAAHLCPRSLDWLHHLLSEYPDHVVEFSAYSVEVGELPGYNTLFWEVRAY